VDTQQAKAEQPVPDTTTELFEAMKLIELQQAEFNRRIFQTH